MARQISGRAAGEQGLTVVIEAHSFQRAERIPLKA
jgi:hypothetical protein